MTGSEGRASASDPTGPAARDRGIALGALAVLIMAAGIALIVIGGGHLTVGRLLAVGVPLFGGALVGAIAVLRVRAAGSFPSATTVPAGGLFGRVAAAIEPYECWFVFFAALAVFLPGLGNYTLIDPWEGHYAEVARRILADNDWVHLRWQDEIFRSKPVLTFWLIASSLNGFGIAQDGGYSGELISSGWVVFAVRLPFTIFAAGGIAAIFWALSKLVSRRLGWMAAAVLATTTFFFMVARQAITDMPMVAAVMGAIACLIMTIERGDEPIEPIAPASPIRWLRDINSAHLFAALFSLFIAVQALYFGAYFLNAPLARGVNVPAPAAIISACLLLWLAGVIVSMFVPIAARQPFTRQTWRSPSRLLAWFLITILPVAERRGQVWMYWFYALVGVALLAKGPPGLGIVGLVSASFLVVSGRWHLLARFEIPRGIALTGLVAVPWHAAMWMRDGPAWVNEYFNHHMLGRFAVGVHGERGTFEFFAAELGVGLWPWAALVPVAIATAVVTASMRAREQRVRLVIGIWAIAGMAMFSISQTKFHHYILPAVPAFSILVAMTLDDIWRGRLTRLLPAALTGIGVLLLICRDLLGEQEKLIELYIYRYDRPWPTGPDTTGTIAVFGVVFAVILAALALPVIGRVSRKIVIGALLAAALAWTYWAGIFYMEVAAPHWGQGALHRTYYAERGIHGIDIKYYGLRELADEWGTGKKEISIGALLPDHFEVGQAATVRLEIPNVGLADNLLVLSGVTVKASPNTLAVSLPAEELAKLAPYLEEGKSARRSRPPWRSLNADRLITWQLNWRGENFWSGGEIYGETEDTRTVFIKTDNKEFNEYIKRPNKVGRTFWVITEAGRVSGLRGLLPTKRGKETFEVVDDESCNKFTLMRFSL